MTVPATPRRMPAQAGDGVNLVFNFDFLVFEDGDVRVVVLDETTSTEVGAVLNTDYTVTRNADQSVDPGGTVNFLVAPTVDEAVTLVGGMAYAQGVALPDGGAYRAENIEQALDVLGILCQQLKEEVDRCAKVPVSGGDADELNESINVLSANLATLQVIVDNIADLVALGSISSEVTTLAAIDDAISAVAAIAAQVVAVVAIDTEIVAVEAIAASVVVVATNMASILAVEAALPTIAAKANAGANADITSLAALTSPLGGFKNLLINGDFRVNQRAYVSGAAVGAPNTYTLDRWRVVSTGQNLAFVASGSGRQVTAPAGGIEQVIEGANIVGGNHTINWTGTATCTVGGVSRAKGAVFALTAGADVTVRFTNGTVAQAQLEAGVVPTMFEHRHLGIEHTLCAWYYRTWEVGYSDTAAVASTRYGFTQFPEMRVAPAVATLTTVGTQANVSSVAFTDITPRGLRLDITPTGAASVVCRRSISLASEL